MTDGGLTLASGALIDLCLPGDKHLLMRLMIFGNQCLDPSPAARDSAEDSKP
jgi:hypothetical protein